VKAAPNTAHRPEQRRSVLRTADVRLCPWTLPAVHGPHAPDPRACGM